MDSYQKGKRTIALNLRNSKAQDVIKRLACKADVFIEPYRPGVMEKYNLGPKELCTVNPKLIYARLTGYGQTGPMRNLAGHDINFVAMSGILSLLGRKHEKPTPPVNLLGDFAGGGIMCALGICLALFERTRSGKGQVIDSAMTDGTAYLSSFLLRSRKMPIWKGGRGGNILDGGAFFYDTYETKDGKYMAAAAFEPEFYEAFTKLLNIEDMEQYQNNEENRELLTNIFKTKTQAEWTEIFKDSDACVCPVLEAFDAPNHPHHVERKTFLDLSKTGGELVPNPQPLLSRTPGKSCVLNELPPENVLVREILEEAGITDDKSIKEMVAEGVLLMSGKHKL